MLTLILMTAFHSVAFSQREEADGYDSIADQVLLKKEMVGGIEAHTLGLGVNFRKGVNKTYFNTRVIEAEFVSMKHPKQVRVVKPGQEVALTCGFPVATTGPTNLLLLHHLSTEKR